MTDISTPTVTPVRKPLRLWPGTVLAVLVVALKFILPLADPALSIYGVLAGVAGLVLILLWWLFFSRAAWIERLVAVVAIAAAVVLTMLLVHPSIAGGFQGLMLYFFCIPFSLGPAFVAWAVATRALPDATRRVTMVATIFLACGFWTLMRTDGVVGEAGTQLTWRWTPTAEERLLARATDEPAPPSASASPATPAPVAAPEKLVPATPYKPAAATRQEDVAPPAADPATPKLRGEWPGFRGASRDGVVRALRIDTDWARTPPAELWRRAIGPGWSSFAVHGGLIYTQEQRGDQEMVSAYSLTTGQPVWRHRDAARFYESNGGPGPRGTPTVHGGRVYTLGATGIANALDAATGAVVWSRNAVADTGAKDPGWGFTSSPLVLGDTVFIATSGRVAAYDIATGNPRWTRKTTGSGYSSPHLATIDGVTQILLQNGGGVTSVAPADGVTLWEHPGVEATSIVQPLVLPDGNVLTAGGDAMGGLGIRRVALLRQGEKWTVQERWHSRGLKPYFNDFVAHNGYAYGFDGTILSCISLEDGGRKWKGGRYGAGQMVLLPDQDLLLVLSEEGELALVAAAPDTHTEIAKFKAIEGKTWNHPVLVGDILLVRNGEEMAAFRLKSMDAHSSSRVPREF